MEVINEEIKELELSGQFDYLRQKSWLDPTKIDSSITVIGAGGIGSMFNLLASKMGITNIIIYDNDEVEAHNLPNQLFDRAHLGMSKVDASKDIMERFGIATVFPRNRMVTPATKFPSKWVLSGVDSMEARKDIWEAVKGTLEDGGEIDRYWDARIGGEGISIFSVDPNNPDEVAAFEAACLYDDDEAVELPCTRRAVIDVMGYVGSFMATELRHAISGEEVPGFLSFSAESMTLETSTLERYAEFSQSLEPAIA